ncbi:hypothetical protein Bca4012_020829 [Brassica carinata]|uniref:Uncharacterized protein n=1 Tax=Brassica carinata TaxID=52824 RepID=A0A8X7WHW1_BRACI|nr:hypothetical protein Bca52824_000807 [Brassica carinata]
MFGRLRPPPSSPDSLERYPAKIIRDDPLSVYESTLLKLKQGSRLDSVGPSPETEIENPSSSSDTQREAHDVTLCNGSDDAMAIDSGSCVKKKNPSVLSMFCRYKNQAQARNLSLTVDTTTTETESAL